MMSKICMQISWLPQLLFSISLTEHDLYLILRSGVGYFFCDSVSFGAMAPGYLHDDGNDGQLFINKNLLSMSGELHSCEAGIMRRHVLPALEELFIQRHAHNFPNILHLKGWRHSTQAFHVYLPARISLSTERLRIYLRSFRNKFIWINTLRLAYHIYQAQGSSWTLLSPQSRVLKTSQSLHTPFSLAR